MKMNSLLKTLAAVAINLLIAINLVAQIPQGINYQAVLRNASGNIIQNQNVTMKFTIHRATPNGTNVYEETQGPIQTNSFGMVNLQIGQGAPTTGTFSSIQWSTNSYFLQVQVDIGNGFVNLGTTQFISVPYAMVADTVLHGGGGGDNWGNQNVVTNATLAGNGTSANPLGVAHQNAMNNQTLKWNGNSWLPADDADAQELSITGSQLSISNGNTVTLPAGSGTGTVTSVGTGTGLTGGPITSVGIISIANTGVTSNTYGNASNFPTFTVNAQGQLTAAGIQPLPVTLPPSGSAGGNLSGIYPNPTVIKIQNIGISSTQPTNGQVLTFNGSNWAPEMPSSGSAWNLIGNAGTNSNNNFVGTIDLQPINFRTNNILTTRISTKGQIEILNTGNSVFIGKAAGAHDDLTSNLNVFVGDSAGFTNTSGYSNTAIGNMALYGNTVGHRNTAIGNEVLLYNLDGDDNTGIGNRALGDNITGDNNTAVGYISLSSNTSGDYNTASGFGSLHSNTIGNRNTAKGYNALYSNIDGNDNTAIGNHTLQANTTGDQNTALGYNALFSNTEGVENVGIGESSLHDNLTGYSNTGIGSSALHSNIDGDYNIAIGNSVLDFNTSGNRNIGIGNFTLETNLTGSYNTCIGSGSDTDASDRTNTVIIAGTGDLPLGGNNRVRIGNNSISSIGGQVSWTTISDERVKVQAKDDVKGLEFIINLKPVTYNYSIEKSNFIQDKKDTINWAGKYDIEKMRFSGFMAQEVEKAAQKAGYNFSGIDKPEEEDGLWGLRYAEFTVPLVKAVQEQQAMIEELKKQVEALQTQIDQFQKNK